MKPKSMFYLLCTLLLSGCATQGEPPQLGTSPLSVPQPHEVQISRAAIDLALDEKNYLQAVHLLRASQKEGAPESEYQDAWSQAFNGLLAQAEQNLAQKEYFEAGKLFRLAIDNLVFAGAAMPAPNGDLARLNERLEDCANLLFERGVLAYRNGKLQQALDIWSKIEGFHPRHSASQRAISTTRLQLHNLAPLPAS